MNISLTKKQEEYIERQVASGNYQNNSEVIKEALRLHQIYQDKVTRDLKASIEKGIQCGISKRSIRDIIKEKQSGRVLT